MTLRESVNRCVEETKIVEAERFARDWFVSLDVALTWSARRILLV